MHDPALHLFIDDHHVRNAVALKRVLHPFEQSHEPILDDIDGRMLAWGCIIHENGRYRLWYQSAASVPVHEMQLAGVWGRGSEFGFFPDRFPGAIRETQTSTISYAESEDGLKWSRPSLGLFEWRGSKANNIVFDGSSASAQFNGMLTNMDSVTVVRDEQDANPAGRYKMINHWETIHVWDNDVGKLNRPKDFMDRAWAHRAKYLIRSADGIRWEPKLTRIKDVEGGDYCGIVRDDRNGHWWFNDRPTVGLPSGYCRLAGLSVSNDLYHWPEHLEQILHPGEFEDYGKRYEHHGFTPFNYGDQDLGMLELSIVGATVANVLVSHRDGEPWRIVSYEPVLQVGPKGSKDEAITVMTRNAPFAAGQRLRLYYNGRNKPAPPEIRFGGLFPAEMRLDGFAAMTVDRLAVQRHMAPAVLQTQHVTVSAPQLELNIAGHGGSAQVALLDEGMRALKGYDVGDCQPIEEDAVRAKVKWKDHDDVAALKGRTISVLVKLQAGSIYAFRL
jgi:hypothetical protein